jgi:hypothetical protein
VRENRHHVWTDWQIPAADPYGAVHPKLQKGSPRHNGYGLNPRPSQWVANHPELFERVWYAAVDAAGWVCHTHDRFMVVTEVQGVYNATKPCTAACRAATGPSCECVCAGERHGSNWG